MAVWDQSALEDLQHHWGDAYEISYRAGGWRARRRDGRQSVFVARDAEQLRIWIRADYKLIPVPRDILAAYTPQRAVSWLNAPTTVASSSVPRVPVR